MSVWRDAAPPYDSATGSSANDTTATSLGITWPANSVVAAIFSIEADTTFALSPELTVQGGDLRASSPALTTETQYSRLTTAQSGTSNSFTAVASAAGLNTAYAFSLPPGKTRYVDVSWTATADTYATGYTLQRPAGTTLSTLTGRTTTTATEAYAPLGTLTYGVTTTFNNWHSTAATKTLTTTAC